ncbi:replication initiation protein [Hymenobacter volaticus]|uniref:Replication initiation protein n=1 Tax=Hymenobacter volaticus TaxID=2932254 RepID=A0ABY4GFZ9_9BACT|nr:replication initiation protein [Hymenobacter volaticus]UOQ69898.1 replication initiation protein [Hymenobacter volaticus]
MNKPEKADKIVTQHNALINARFSFVPLQMRLFLALLARIEFEDTDFREHFVPFSEIGFTDRGGSSYQLLEEVCEKLTSFTLYIEELEPGTRRRRKRPNYKFISLMDTVEYQGDRGGVLASFNPSIMPYLLQLRESGNFTTAALAELRKLKSPYALRIYWLLKEYADFGQRTLSLEQLRFMLDIAENEYPRFSNFKARVLDKAQSELAATDMPFTFELERQNQIVQKIRFLIELSGKPQDREITDDTELIESSEALENVQHTEKVEHVEYAGVPAWHQELLKAGVSKRSVQQISKQLQAGEYPLGYVDFVLARITKLLRLGKVKKPAGAIYKALVDKYLLAEYLESQTKVATRPVVVPAIETLEEVAMPLSEVEQMYQNPGPFLKKMIGEETFEQHLQRLYLNEGFVIEQRAGVEWLVKH